MWKRKFRSGHILHVTIANWIVYEDKLGMFLGMIGNHQGATWKRQVFNHQTDGDNLCHISLAKMQNSVFYHYWLVRSGHLENKDAPFKYHVFTKAFTETYLYYHLFLWKTSICHYFSHRLQTHWPPCYFQTWHPSPSGPLCLLSFLPYTQFPSNGYNISSLSSFGFSLKRHLN